MSAKKKGKKPDSERICAWSRIRPDEKCENCAEKDSPLCAMHMAALHERALVQLKSSKEKPSRDFITAFISTIMAAGGTAAATVTIEHWDKFWSIIVYFVDASNVEPRPTVRLGENGMSVHRVYLEPELMIKKIYMAGSDGYSSDEVESSTRDYGVSTVGKATESSIITFIQRAVSA